MKRALVALIAGTVLSGFAAAYASTIPHVASSDESPQQTAPAKPSAGTLAASH